MGFWPGKKLAKVRTCLERFKTEMLKREQSLSGAWRRCLDPKWHGRLTMSDFLGACRELGYRDNMHQLWRDLDINSHGYIELKELAWDECIILGEFYNFLLRQYKDCQAAAIALGMHGPKRFHLDEWITLCMKGRLCGGRRAADKLFRMLCSCPLHDGRSAFQGTLGHGLADKAPAVTAKAFAWLDKIGPTCPRPARNRVSPGTLGAASPTATLPGSDQEPAMKERDLQSPGQTPSTQLEFGPACTSSGDDWGEEDFEMDDQGSEYSSEICNSRFMRLYEHALDYHRRRDEMANQGPEQLVFDRELPTQDLYDKLYGDAAAKDQRMQERMLRSEQERHRDFNLGAVEKRAPDPKAKERLHASKKKQEPRLVEANLWRQHVWESMDISELIHEADRLAAEMKDNHQKKHADQDAEAAPQTEPVYIEGVPILSWKSFGKSRKQILEFLKKADEMLKQHARDTDREKEPPHTISRLFEDAESRKERQEDRIEQHRQQREYAFEETYKCEMHGDRPEKRCHICNRYKALMEGIEKPKTNSKNLIELAENQVRDKIMEWEGMFEDLLEDADRKGLLHNRDFLSAKVALKERFSQDPRWDAIQGINRDKLITRAISDYTRKREEAEKAGKQYRATKTGTDPEIYYRLHLDATNKHAWRATKMQEKQQEEDQLMQEISIHKSEANRGVFNRLYRNDKKEREEVPEESLNQLAGLPSGTQWKHKLWREPEIACSRCGTNVTSGYKVAHAAPHEHGFVICDTCTSAAVAHEKASQDLLNKRVWVSWRGNYWHRAKVMAMNEDGTYFVIYEDDGKCDYSVPRSYIKVPEEKHSKYEPGYRPLHSSSKTQLSPDSPTSPSTTSPRRSLTNPQEKIVDQVLRFTFADAPWPPPKYFDSEFRYNLEMLAGQKLGKIKLRFREASETGGVIAELGTTEEKLQMIQRLPLGDLEVTDYQVSEVWCQDYEEDPLADFADWIQSAFGSVDEAFRAIAGGTSATLSRKEFVSATSRRGFDGNAKFVWLALDSGKGLLSLADLQQLQPYIMNKSTIISRNFPQLKNLTPVAASQSEQYAPVHEFAKMINGLFPDLKTAFMHLDNVGRGEVSYQDFVAGADSLGWAGDSKLVFRELDRARNGHLSMQEWEEGLSKVMAIAQHEENMKLITQTQSMSSAQTAIAAAKTGKGLRPAKGKGRGKASSGSLGQSYSMPSISGEEARTHSGSPGSHQATFLPMEARMMQAQGSQLNLATLQTDELPHHAEFIMSGGGVGAASEHVSQGNAARASANQRFRHAGSSIRAAHTLASGAQHDRQVVGAAIPGSRIQSPRDSQGNGSPLQHPHRQSVSTGQIEEPVHHASSLSAQPSSPGKATPKANPRLDKRVAAAPKVSAKAGPSNQQKLASHPQEAARAPQAPRGQQTNRWSASAKAKVEAGRKRDRHAGETNGRVLEAEPSATAARSGRKKMAESQQQPPSPQRSQKPPRSAAKAKPERPDVKVKAVQGVQKHPPPSPHRGDVLAVDFTLRPQDYADADEELFEVDRGPTVSSSYTERILKAPASLMQRARNALSAFSAAQRIKNVTGDKHAMDTRSDSSPSKEVASPGKNAMTPTGQKRMTLKNTPTGQTAFTPRSPVDAGDFQDADRAFDQDRLLREFTELLLESYQDLDTAYQMLDLSGQGNIGPSEFRAACRSMGYMGDAMQVFRAIDTQKTGVIGKRDFAQLFKYVIELQPSQSRQQTPRRVNQDVKKHMLEQQWAKKPSVAKTNLVVNAQQKVNR